MYNWKAFYLILCVSAFLPLANPVSLSAQDMFRAGRWYIDASYGLGEPDGKAIQNIRNTQDSNNLISGLLYSNQSGEAQSLSLLYLTAAPSVSAKSETYQIGLSYSMSSWFSLGVRAESHEVTFRNVSRFNPLSDLAILIGAGPLRSDMPVSVIDYLPLILVDDVTTDPVQTLSMDMGFHFFSSGALDPYLKLQLGGGAIKERAAYRAGAALGVNIGLGDYLFLKGEAFSTAYRLRMDVSDGIASSNVDYTDTGFRLGMGFALFN